MMKRILAAAVLALAAGPPALAQPAPAGGVPLGLRLLFVAVDRNADGRIDEAEADQFVDNLFAQADSNGDARLSLAEVLAQQARLAPGAAGERAAKVQFRQMDRNRDGFVDGREANKASIAHFAFLDADKDGVITLADLAGRDLTAPSLGAAAAR
ncbi:EF-hand domain-containing protein [Zavarzinia compransoris]|nr:hypothetical protein [Zavarzinia compransoris]TDP43333.1 EF hand domain-containing protein [Zavarzinia compransoris]